MVINLTAVLPDGTNLRAGTPTNPRTPLRLSRFTNVTINVQVQRPGGAFLNLTGSTLTLTVKKRPSDGSPAFVGTATIQGTLASFSIIPSNFNNWFSGLYGYDIVLVQGSGARDVVLPLSPCFVEDTEAKYP